MKAFPPDTTPVDLVNALGYHFYCVVTETTKGGLPPSEMRKIFIREHAVNMAMLLHNVGTLSSTLQSYSTQLLVRPMLEGFFNMMAAIRNPIFTTSKMVAELEKLQLTLDKYISAFNPTPTDLAVLQRSKAEMDAVISQMKTTYGVKSRGWNVAEVAKEGGCEKWYYVDYTMLCQQTHTAFASLNPLMPTTRGMLLRTSSYIGLNALCAFQQFFDPSKTTEYEQQRDNFAGLVRLFETNGAYAKLQWEPVQPKPPSE